MDDLTVTNTTHVQARWILTALEVTLEWARMKFKPRKSQSLIIKRSKVTEEFSMLIQGEEIPSIVNNPIKCLVKWCDARLNESNNIRRVQGQVKEGLRAIDKTGLPGKFKVWLFQYELLPRLIWPLTLHIRKIEEEIRKAKVVEMGAQGAWMRWGTTDRRLSWLDIWRMEPCRIQFLLRSVYDLLPSPTNLHR